VTHLGLGGAHLKGSSGAAKGGAWSESSGRGQEKEGGGELHGCSIEIIRMIVCQTKILWHVV
jgi:hypothetical protein